MREGPSPLVRKIGIPNSWVRFNGNSGNSGIIIRHAVVQALLICEARFI
jgi:hypothetical protein